MNINISNFIRFKLNVNRPSSKMSIIVQSKNLETLFYHSPKKNNIHIQLYYIFELKIIILYSYCQINIIYLI